MTFGKHKHCNGCFAKMHISKHHHTCELGYKLKWKNNKLRPREECPKPMTLVDNLYAKEHYKRRRDDA